MTPIGSLFAQAWSLPIGPWALGTPREICGIAHCLHPCLECARSQRRGSRGRCLKGTLLKKEVLAIFIYICMYIHMYMAVSILYLHKDFSKEEHHGKVFKCHDMGPIGPGPKWAQGQKGPRPKWAQGPNGPRAQLGPGANGPRPKWAQAQMGPGPNGPGPKWPGPKWARAQRDPGRNGPGPKWAQAQIGPGPKM